MSTLRPESKSEINGKLYLIGNIDAWNQFHIFRRLTPLLTNMGPGLFNLLMGETDPKNLAREDWLLLAFPVLEQLAPLPQADVDYVFKECLRVVRVKVGDSWSPVLADGSVLMNQGLQMTELLRLVLDVIRHNLNGFFQVPQPDSSL